MKWSIILLPGGHFGQKDKKLSWCSRSDQLGPPWVGPHGALFGWREPHSSAGAMALSSHCSSSFLSDSSPAHVQRSKHISVPSGPFATPPHWGEQAPWGMLTSTKAFMSWLRAFVASLRPSAPKWLDFLTPFFFLGHRSTHSEARTGVNTVPTSCGGSSPKGSGAQVDTQLSLSFFHLYQVPPCWAEGQLSRAGK